MVYNYQKTSTQLVSKSTLITWQKKTGKVKRPLFCSHFQKSIMSRTVKSIITSKKCFCLPDNDRFQKVQSSLCNYPDALLFFFLQKQKCLMIIFTIASQTLEASYYCWLVYARGLKWPHLLFFFRF